MDAVLPVPFVDFDHNVYENGDISQMSCEQYMSWVRHQAENMPTVFRADIDTSAFEGRQTPYMPRVDGISPCPEAFLPHIEWTNNALFEFSELRGQLGRLALQHQAKDKASKARKFVVPAMKEKASWRLFCFGPIDASDSAHNSASGAEEVSEEEDDQFLADDAVPDECADTNEEQAEITLQEKRQRLLTGLDLELNSDAAVPSDSTNEPSAAEEGDPPDEGVPLLPPKRWDGQVGVPPSVSLLLQFDHVLTQKLLTMHTEWLNSSQITPQRGAWLYGLLARLEKPLYQDTAAVVRQLYRRCSELRSQLNATSEGFDESLAVLNLLVGVAGTYFGQGEHAHDAGLQHCAGQTDSAAESGGVDIGYGQWGDDDDDEEEGGDDCDAGGADYPGEEDIEDGEIL